MSVSREHKQTGVVVGAAFRKAVHWYYLAALATVIILLTGSFIFFRVYKSAPPTSNQLTDTTPGYAAHPSSLVKIDTTALNSSNTSQEKAEIYASLGFDYLGTKQYDQSIEAFQNSLRIGGYDTAYRVRVMNGLASAYSMSGQQATAISEFQQIIALAQQSNDSKLEATIPSYQYLISQLRQGDSL